MLLRGSAAVARQAISGLRHLIGHPAAEVVPVLVNGLAGAVVTIEALPVSVISFTVADGRISHIDAIGDPARVRAIAMMPVGQEQPGRDL